MFHCTQKVGHLLTKIRQWFTSPAPPRLIERVADLEVACKKQQREIDDLHDDYIRLRGRKGALARHDPDPDPDPVPVAAAAPLNMNKIQLWQRAREKLKR